MYGKNITIPEKVQNLPQLFNNTHSIELIRNRILVSLILEPQTHFDTTNINFISGLRMDNFPNSNGTNFYNTYGNLSTSNIPDLIHTQNLSSLLTIDRVYDVFLESMSTFGAVFNDTKNNMAFKLTINEFNMNTSSNTLNNVECLIPNINKVSANPKTTIYRDKKLYHIATTTPDKLSRITGRISTLDNKTIFRNVPNPNNIDRLNIDLVLIPR